MIVVQTLPVEALNAFKGKTVILYAQVRQPLRICKILQHYGINVVACCTEKKVSFFQCLIDAILGGPKYITQNQLKDYSKKYNNLMIQTVSGIATKKNLQSMKQQILELNLEESGLVSGEIVESFDHLLSFKSFKNPFRRWIIIKRNSWFGEIRPTLAWWQFLINKHKTPIVMCSPPKTADVTIDDTLQNLIGANEYINLAHDPKLIYKLLSKKRLPQLKMIAGVREPISQNLSALYHSIALGVPTLVWMTSEVINGSNINNVLDHYEKLFSKADRDVQSLWDTYTNLYMNSDVQVQNIRLHNSQIQFFFSSFLKNVVDITNYPFDQERGYTIVEEGNIKLFVYQLEKLNSLVPELSAWVGVPFDKLENGNQANDKWIADSYKQAQEKIEITQEYFDKCFNEPYVKHCYSEADIEKFKDKWRPHIKR